MDLVLTDEHPYPPGTNTIAMLVYIIPFIIDKSLHRILKFRSSATFLMQSFLIKSFSLREVNRNRDLIQSPYYPRAAFPQFNQGLLLVILGLSNVSHLGENHYLPRQLSS